MIVIAPRTTRLRAAALWGIPMLAAGGYWYVRNLIAVGNPIPYVGSLGPISLPAPVRDFQLRPDFAVVHYWNDTEVWRHWFGPGLDDSFGTLWPLTLAAMLAVAVLALWRGREPILRALGACRGRDRDRLRVHAADRRGRGGPADLVRVERPLPGPRRGRRPGDPAVPARAAGDAAPPGGGPRRAHGAARVHGRLAGPVGAGPHQGRRGGRRRWWSPAAAADLAPALARHARPGRPPGASGRRWRSARSWRSPSPPATPSRTTTSPTGTRTPARSRTSTSALRWSRDVRDARIAVGGIRAVFTQYPFYGTDLSNRVQWLGLRGPHDAYRRIPDCRQWRRAINAGGYTHVVTTFDPYLPGRMRNSPEGRWTQSDPNARVVLRDGPVRVFELRGPLDPAGCAGQRPLTQAQLHSVPNLSGTPSNR